MEEEEAGVVKLNFNPKVPVIPRGVKKDTDIRYMLIAPFANVYIYWDEKIGNLVYSLEEPILNDKDKENLDKIEEAMMDMVNINMITEKNQDNLMEYVDKTIRIIISEMSLDVSEDSFRKIVYYLYRNFIGLNEIEPLMHDYFIEDIECNGVGEPLYIVHRVFRNMKTNIKFDSVDKLANFVEKLAQKTGRYISYASPLLDGTLPDGSRVNATYTTDVTSKGPTFTIRKFTKTPWTPIQLLSFNSLSPEMLAYFWILMQYKSNVMITGGTATGKTTLLNAIAFFIPPEGRVVSIEDSVTGDSKLFIRQEGLIRNIGIKEFVEKRVNAEVMSLNDEGKIVWVKPLDYIKHLIKKDIYEITTATGRKVKVTKDHSLFSLGDDGLKEIKPTELTENSFIAVPRVLPIDGRGINRINLMEHLEVFEDDFLVGKPLKRFFDEYKLNDFDVKKEKYRWWRKNNLIKIKDFMRLDWEFNKEELNELKIKSKNKSCLPVLFDINKEFLEFFGLWVGDGSYDNYNKNSVILSNVDDECKKIFMKIANDVKSNYSLMNDNGVSMRIHSSVFYKFMKYVLDFDGYSATKKVPDFVFNLSKEQINDFLRGYFSAEGCVEKNEISCASQSYELLEGIQSLFLRQGIISRISDFDRKDKCINLFVSGFENINKFKKIGFLQERKNFELNLMDKKAGHTCSDVVPLSLNKRIEFDRVSLEKLQQGYLSGRQNIGRNYMQRIAPVGCEFNDLSHNDILWDKIKMVKKFDSEEVEVFDLSIPKHEKFLCNNIFVHNTRELNLPRQNWLPTVARTGISTTGVGEINMFRLLKNSFRQNPDYVIVGEVRGKEAYVLFQGMASGHASISTMHANSVDSVIRRLETPPINLNASLVNSLDAVAIMSRVIVKGKESRKLTDIVEVVDVNDDGVALTNTPFVWNPADDKFYFKKGSKVFEKIEKKHGISKEELEKEFEMRTKLIYELFRRKIFGFDEIEKIVNDYYRNPEEILVKFGLSKLNK